MIYPKNKYNEKIKLYWSPAKMMWGYEFKTEDGKHVSSSFSHITAKDALTAGLKDYETRLGVKTDE
jgi:hypothetical protein